MKQNLISINAIIDASGSMAGLTNDTIGGFNTFLKQQKDFPGEALFTLCTFNNNSKLIHNAQHISKIDELSNVNYVPGGGTALLDAIGSTIAATEAKMSVLPEEERPGKVIFLIITDGEENASREYTLDTIKAKITQKQSEGWDFVFMGANIDAFKAGASLGVASSNIANYSADIRGTTYLYDSISENMSSYRSCAPSKTNAASFFSVMPASDTIDNSKAVANTPVLVTDQITNDLNFKSKS